MMPYTVDNSIGEIVLFSYTKIITFVAYEHIALFKTYFIKQYFYALACCKFPSPVRVFIHFSPLSS